MTPTPSQSTPEMLAAAEEAVKVSDNERKVLKVLSEYCVIDEGCIYTRTIAKLAKMEFRLARRCVRSLVRKGLAEFHRGLMDDDGMVAGSGYCASQKGKALSELK